MGTTWVTPSPESNTTPVVRPVAYLHEAEDDLCHTDNRLTTVFMFVVYVAGSSHKLSTACMEMKRAGTLKVSKKTSAAFSLFLLGLRGASVSSTGCCETQKDAWASAQIPKRRNVNGEERRWPPLRRSAAAPWSKRTARSSPCRSSPSLCRVPSDTSQTTSPCAPDQQRGGGDTEEKHCNNTSLMAVGHADECLPKGPWETLCCGTVLKGWCYGDPNTAP